MRPLVLLIVASASTCVAGEYALLANGGRLHIDRHEIAGAKADLYVGSGSIEMDAAEIRGFEPDEFVPVAAKLAPAALPQTTAASPQQMADEAARKYGLPSSLVLSVMKAESGFHPGAVSPKGAVGLMQLMPDTARGLGANPRDPLQNVEAGARYLRELLEKYNGGLRHALAAYNAGPAAVDRYHGVPPFPETMEYVRRIERDWKESTEPRP